MEGKLQHIRSLTKKETERVFSLIVNQREAFISVAHSQSAALTGSSNSLPRVKTGVSLGHQTATNSKLGF